MSLLADTSVVLRLFWDDDRVQSRRARRLVREVAESGGHLMLAESVVCELMWTLEKMYGLSRQIAAEALLGLLESDAWTAWDPDLAFEALGEVVGDPKLSVVDALLVVRARRLGLPVASFDHRILAAVAKA